MNHGIDHPVDSNSRTKWPLSLCMPKRSWRSPYLGPGYLVLAVGVAVSATSDACAQTAFDQPFAAPVIGTSTPVSDPRRFSVVPSVRTAYDTNVLRSVDLGGPRDNVRVTPGIDLDYQRRFGRVALGISGSAGYDFNSRFRFLNQSRIDFNGSARAPVGSVCSITADASYNKFSFDPNDTQASAGSTSITQIYDINANCSQRGGFTPVAGFTYTSIEGGQASFFDYRQYAESLGLAYAQPSIGTVTLNATAMQLRRPNLAELTGFNDNTNIYSLTLGLNRSVAPRIQISASGGITKADPRRASAPGFLGASYSGQLKWLPNPRLTVTGTAVRQVTSQTGISATYVIRENYGLTAGLKVSSKSRFDLSGSHTIRDFRGDDLTPALQSIRKDRTNTVSANYNYDLSRRIRIGLALRRRWRKADNPFYDYTSTILSSSIGANF
jgi:hypothetical protein